MTPVGSNGNAAKASGSNGSVTVFAAMEKGELEGEGRDDRAVSQEGEEDICEKRK